MLSIKGQKSKPLKNDLRDQSNIYESKSCHICRRTMYVEPIYLCKHSIEPVLANIPKQSVRPWSINVFLQAFIAI